MDKLEIFQNTSQLLLSRMLLFSPKTPEGRPSPQWILSTRSKEVEDHCTDMAYDYNTHKFYNINTRNISNQTIFSKKLLIKKPKNKKQQFRNPLPSVPSHHCFILHFLTRTSISSPSSQRQTPQQSSFLWTSSAGKSIMTVLQFCSNINLFPYKCNLILLPSSSTIFQYSMKFCPGYECEYWQPLLRIIQPPWFMQSESGRYWKWFESTVGRCRTPTPTHPFKLLTKNYISFLGSALHQVKQNRQFLGLLQVCLATLATIQMPSPLQVLQKFLFKTVYIPFDSSLIFLREHLAQCPLQQEHCFEQTKSPEGQSMYVQTSYAKFPAVQIIARSSNIFFDE